MNNRRLLFALATCSTMLFGQQATLLPGHRLMPKLTANATEHGISVNKLLSVDNFFCGIGGSMAIAGFQYGTLNGDLTVASTIYTQLDRIPRHLRVINTDFYVDIDATVTWNASTFVRAGIGHTSQHLNDDAIEQLGLGPSINYVRDYSRLFVLQKTELINGFVYGGVYYHTTFRVPAPGNFLWMFEFGMDGLNYSLSSSVTSYVAFDVKLRDELSFGSTQSYQAGVKIHGASSQGVRIAYTYRTGFEERGQFYDKKADIHSVGFYFDF